MHTLNFRFLVTTGLGLCLMMLAPWANALDDRRNGFLLAFGGGVHGTSIDYDIDDLNDSDEERYSDVDGYGLALQLSIGGAFADRFGVSGTHQVARYRIDGEDHMNYVLGVTGTYWFRSTRPSVYISAMFGRQLIDKRGIFDSATGDAFRFALGYEFANRLHLEGGLTIGDGTGFYYNFIDDDASLDSISTQVIASFTWY